MTGLWFLPTRPLRLNTKEYIYILIYIYIYIYVCVYIYNVDVFSHNFTDINEIIERVYIIRLRTLNISETFTIDIISNI